MVNVPKNITIVNNPGNPAIKAMKEMPCKYCSQMVYKGDLVKAVSEMWLHFPMCWHHASSDIEWKSDIKAEKKFKKKLVKIKLKIEQQFELSL